MSRTVRHPLPFRYPGGKHYAIGILRPFWSASSHQEYREPFVGGGSVFFNKPKVQENWLNDIDSELMDTYEVLQDTRLRNDLVQMVSNEVASKERWREVYDSKPKGQLQQAFRYFYLNRTSFSGKLVSAAWGYRPKRSLPPERWHERIKPCGKKLEGVRLTSGDFSEVIAAPGTPGRKVLIFADPPYYAPPKKKHYRNGFSQDDHIRLMECLRDTRHNFFLTYDDVPEVRDLYNWANIYPAKFFYRVDNSNVQKGNRRLGFEVIVTNYELEQQIAGQYELAM